MMVNFKREMLVVQVEQDRGDGVPDIMVSGHVQIQTEEKLDYTRRRRRSKEFQSQINLFDSNSRNFEFIY